jgi:hypothetical protein
MSSASLTRFRSCLSTSTAMLPEAYEAGGDYAGLMTLLGFLSALFVKLMFEKKGGEGAVCSIECYNHDLAPNHHRF